MERDLTSSVEPKVAFNIQAIASDTTTAGNIIDTKGFESVDISLITGTVTDGDYSLTIVAGDVVDSESAPTVISDAAAVASDNIIGTLPAFTDDADDDSVKHVGVVTKKRWIQCSVVSLNTSTGATVGAQATLGHAAKRPTA